MKSDARIAAPRETTTAASPLDAFFLPTSIAVVGATESLGETGRAVFANLLDAPNVSVYPVNPQREFVFGRRAYPNVSSLPEAVDLGVIVTPAASVPDIVRECADSAVKAALIISAGFREAGPAGHDLEQRVLTEARRSGIRIIGPNCLGLMNPVRGLNATFAGAMALPGSVALLSQGGAICTALLDWSLRERVGFSAFVSVGSMIDVSWGDLLEYFGDDPRTKSILLYMESIGDARSFLSAAREAALKKPIIVIKAGRTEEAAKAAISHTGAMTGSDEMLDAAFQRSGILRVNSIAGLFYMAEVLGRQPRPKGPRLTIVTNAGGAGVLATDALVANEGELAQLTPATLAELDKFLPPHWSHGNPIDVLGDTDVDRYARAVDLAIKDANSDGLLAIVTPQAMTNPAALAETLVRHAHCGKPVLASWMGGNSVAEAEALLNRTGIPTFPYPDTAARAFNYMWQYSRNLSELYETPSALPRGAHYREDRLASKLLIDCVRKSGRTLLTETESKELLTLYGIPTVPGKTAKDEETAALFADQIGYPVVLKLHSTTITHKTEVGGVKLNLQDGHAVRRAFQEIRASVHAKCSPHDFEGVSVQPMQTGGYELILGSTTDAQLGPVLLFGSGGQLVEVFRDRAIGLPPLTTTLARRLMERTLIYKALNGVRGQKAVDLNALEILLVRFSQLVAEHPAIREIDINPLLASSAGMIALDARVVLQDRSIADWDLPRTAIRAYPIQYSSDFTMHNGEQVTIRPIRPDDESLMIAFHKELSEHSVHMRYGNTSTLSFRTAHERLTRVCFIDYDREMALVAENVDYGIIGVGRLIKDRARNAAEFALVVADKYQTQGLGSELLNRVLAIARQEGIESVYGFILPDNARMQSLARELGFALEFPSDGGLIEARVAISK
jgi:acetyltransferase